MDTGDSQPNAVDVDGGAELFTELLNPEAKKEPEAKVETPEPDPKTDDALTEGDEEGAKDNAADEGDDAPVTITVDGKQVTLTKAELADAYKNGLRQSDYTRKTMEAAEQRKTAEAAIAKATQERQTYAQNLTKMAAQLEGALQQQAKIDWDGLLAADPVEFLRQQHLQSQRQAALQQNQQELGRVAEQDRIARAGQLENHLATQQQELLAKLPDWKDEKKATAEKAALKAHLIERGYSPEEVAGINDHKAVLLARDAMLYRQMMDKASAAAKKVSTLPAKVERPGTSSEKNPTDGRNAAMQRLSRSGSIDDAAAVFTSLMG